MNWFLMAIMSLTHQQGAIDTYIWYNPTFENVEQCIEFVKDNNEPIYFTLMREFPNDRLDKLFCVPEDKLREFLQANKQLKQGQSL